VNNHPTAPDNDRKASPEEKQDSPSVNVIALLVWLVAGAVAFIPFAFDTSPWDAVTLHVPGNQGNWWHFLAGAPFFLAFPMIWLRLRPMFGPLPSTPLERRLIWAAVASSAIGTTMVEAPFLLHLAGTSEWQRFSVLGLGFGTMGASAILLLRFRRQISPTRACLAGLETAYLANAALCLVVYSNATGSSWSRSGWLVSMGIVWPIAFDLIWILILAMRIRAPHPNPRAA
jgi:hypothetical protein